MRMLVCSDTGIFMCSRLLLFHPYLSILYLSLYIYTPIVITISKHTTLDKLKLVFIIYMTFNPMITTLAFDQCMVSIVYILYTVYRHKNSGNFHIYKNTLLVSKHNLCYFLLDSVTMWWFM